MPTDSLTAAANTGSGTDKIAGKQSPGALGFIGASFLTDKNGIDVEWPARVPDNAAQGLPVRAIGQEVWNFSFSNVRTGFDPAEWTTRRTGTGYTVTQSGGSGVVVAGTTTNAEFLARSTIAWRGSMMLSFSTVLSQRIANNNFAVLLADLVGEGLTCTINSATSISVAKTDHGFTAENVGQFMYVGAISAAAAGVPGRYAIASIPNAGTINFTVAGWPASGSCTVDLFGHSHVRHIYNGTSASAMNFTTQRRGWGDAETAASMNSTASPGHIVKTELQGRSCTTIDMLRASGTSPVSLGRATRFENLPDDNLDLYVYVWSFNGATAPASSTTWTISFVSVEKYPNTPVYIQGLRPMHSVWAMPVQIYGTVGVNGSVALTGGQAGLAGPNNNADVASAAITSTVTSSTFTVPLGSSYSINIPVTAVSGTTPTLDFSIEESDDLAGNWFKVYDFPRITATGIYRSPNLIARGNRVRYVQTIAGTTPSFTRAVNRVNLNTPGQAISQIIDRTVSLTTISSVTPWLNVQNCSNLQLALNLGAATTPPALQLEGSDDNGLTAYPIGSPLTGTASATVQATTANINAQLVRARVSTVGAGVTPGYVLIKGF